MSLALLASPSFVAPPTPVPSPGSNASAVFDAAPPAAQFSVFDAAPPAAQFSNATRGRRLLQGEFSREGTFCSHNHLMPLALMLGCQRCGGQSLYEDVMNSVRGARRGHALRGEPEHYGREQHFYATDAWSQGVPHYLEHFPPCPRQQSSPYEFTVDATPAYLRKPIVADRLVEVLPRNAVPKLRFVVILRDPVDRLYAYWDAFVLSGVGVNRFEAWADKTMENVLACQKRVGSNELWPPPDTGVCDEDTVEGVAAGLYAYQLIYWLHRFDPKQFLVTTIDAYERDPQRVVRDVAGHVGASTTLAGAVRAASDPTAVKVMGGMTADARRKLGRFYQPHNAQLLHVFNGQPHVAYSPSIKELRIQGWTGPN